METTNPYAPPTADLEVTPVSPSVRPPFFAVSPLKLFVMGWATLGLYFIYWHYRQWKAIRDAGPENLWPIPRAIFAPLTGFELYPRIHKAATEEDIATDWLPWVLPLAALILNAAEWGIRLTTTAESPWRFWGMLAILPPILAQRTVQELHAKIAPDADRNRRFTALNIVAVVVGGLMWLLLLLSRLVPTPA